MKASHEYSVSVDGMDHNAWTEILCQFNDTSVFQTWSYGKERCGEENLSHIVLRRDGHLLAAAQVMLLRTPFFGLGAAFVHWGPLWHPQGSEACQEDLLRFLHALRDEYAVKRKLLVRLVPRDFEDESGSFAQLVAQEGYRPARHLRPKKTIIVDLAPSIQDLRKNLSHGWRQSLNRAERSNLEIRIVTNDSVCETFPAVFGEMHRRQKFVGGENITPVMNVQRDLPEHLKTKFFMCYYEGQAVAGMGCSPLGDTAFCWVAAASQEGLQLRAAQLVWWRAVEHVKEQGFRQIDLGGSDEERVPGPTRFKRMLAGREYVEVTFAGPFEAWSSPASVTVVHLGEWAREKLHATKALALKLFLRGPKKSSKGARTPASPPED